MVDSRHAELIHTTCDYVHNKHIEWLRLCPLPVHICILTYRSCYTYLSPTFHSTDSTSISQWFCRTFTSTQIIRTVDIWGLVKPECFFFLRCFVSFLLRILIFCLPISFCFHSLFKRVLELINTKHMTVEVTVISVLLENVHNACVCVKWKRKSRNLIDKKNRICNYSHSFDFSNRAASDQVLLCDIMI